MNWSVKMHVIALTEQNWESSLRRAGNGEGQVTKLLTEEINPWVVTQQPLQKMEEISIATS